MITLKSFLQSCPERIDAIYIYDYGKEYWQTGGYICKFLMETLSNGSSFGLDEKGNRMTKEEFMENEEHLSSSCFEICTINKAIRVFDGKMVEDFPWNIVHPICDDPTKSPNAYPINPYGWRPIMLPRKPKGYKQL